MDTRSVNSDTSASSKPLDCPCCKKQIASRSMFLHLKSKHPGYFQQQTTAKWLAEAQAGKPLKVFWEVKNDFDETTLLVLFGCLASGKTFNMESKAITHFKKNPNDLKEHNKQINLLLDARNSELKKERIEQQIASDVPPQRAEYKKMKENDDPELCNAIMEVNKNYIGVCEKLVGDCKQYINMDWKTSSPETPGAQKVQTVAETIDMFERQKVRMSKNPTDYKTIANIHYHLLRVLHLRKFFNGYLAPELAYPWFYSLDHPEGELSNGDSKFAKYIWPWETPMNPIDSSASYITVL